MGYLASYSTSKSDDMSKRAFEYLVANTLNKNLHGADKLVELTGLDAESSMTTMLPALMYTFKYNSDHIDREGTHSFMDYVPVIFCMGIDNEYVYGLNFNLLPTDVRAAVLDCIVETDADFYNRIVFKEGFNLSSNIVKICMDDTYRKLYLKVIDDKTGVKVSNAYRKYKKCYLENVRLIEYDMWQYIPHLVFKDSIRGADLSVVQKSIIETAK